MKYTFHFGSTTPFLSDPDFFIGTSFMGVDISSKEEFKKQLIKTATYTKNGKTYWRNKIKITFHLASTTEAFKANGNKQCEENGFVNLLEAATVLRNDPFKDISIIYRPGGWLDEDGVPFKCVLLKKDKITPMYNGLFSILEDLGVELD